MPRTIIGWVENETLRQLRENKVVVYATIHLQDPGCFGYSKIEINRSEESVTK